jgi:hypothetical protein
MPFRETVAVYCENSTEHTDTVRTSRKTHYVSATEPNRLMLYGETVAVYSENNTEHKVTLCVQNVAYTRIQSVPHRNPLGLRYKDQPVNVVLVNSPCLGKQSPFMRIIGNTNS